MILLNSDNEWGAIPLTDFNSSGNPHLGFAQNPQIQRSLQQAMELLERRNIMKRKHDIRKLLSKLPDRSWQSVRKHRRRTISHIERPQFTSFGATCLDLCGLGQRQNRARVLLKSLARLRKENVAIVALEQSSSNFLFERPDLNTQRRLRHVKALSRTVKAASSATITKYTSWRSFTIGRFYKQMDGKDMYGSCGERRNRGV
jgi:hypothetical protein